MGMVDQNLLHFGPNLIKHGRLLVPGLELIYLWNGFSIIGRHYNLVESVYVAVQVSTPSLSLWWLFMLTMLSSGGRGGLEVRKLFNRELLPSPPSQRGLPQIYGWDMWAIYIWDMRYETSASDVWVRSLLRWSSLCRCEIVTPMITLMLIQ